MILDKIVSDNIPELAEKKRHMSVSELEKVIYSQPAPLDFAASLKGDSIKLIAEVKKASPSRGVIRTNFDPATIARIYAANGAAAISVLTEEKYFQGKLDFVQDVREATGRKIPVLRKDFIHDPYQVYETRASGADAMLLIAALLTPEKLNELLKLSHDLGMYCLVEVHNEVELNMVLDTEAEIIGINNRDLQTFKVDLSATEKLRPLILTDRTVVSESGIHSRKDIIKLKSMGIDAVLIGEAFMAAKDIAEKMREMIGEV